jgi:archaellum component FlaC
MKNFMRNNNQNNSQIHNKGIVWAPLIAIAALGILGWFAVTNWSAEILNLILSLLNALAAVILPAVYQFFNILAQFAALIINSFIVLNPFSGITVAPLLWEFFKNISYVVLVFLSLWAGFQFILSREDEARRLLIGILIVAFLINFTFVLAKEFFMFFWYLTKNVLSLIGNVYSIDNNIDRSNFGEILYASLSFLIGKQGQDIGNKIFEEIRAIAPSTNDPRLTEQTVLLSFNLFFLIMSFIGSALMLIFAGIAFGKFFIISFLVGVLPLACIAYLLPNQKGHFDQWWKLFFTWNINILVLIVLIMIGIFLFASPDSINNLSQIFLANLKENNSIFGNLGDTASTLAIAISLSLRFFIIAVYYGIVILVALKMGGQFAEAGYNFAKWSWTKTGSLISDQAKNLAAGPLNRLGDKMNDVANKLAQYGPTGALLAKRIRSAAKTLQKPAKEHDKEIAEEMWEAVKNKSPEEIARAADKLRGGTLNEFAELISKNKSADEIFKIFTQSERLQEDIKARKTLCKEKLDCALDSIMKPEEREKAMQLLAQRLDFTKTNLRDFESIFSQLNIGDAEKRQLYQVLTSYLRNPKNFFAHPTNLSILQKSGLGAILDENQNIIRQTPTYRLFNEGLNNILNNMRITDPELRRRITEGYLSEYMEGKIDEDKLRGWMENDARQLRADVENKATQLLQQQREELNAQISSLEQERNNLNQLNQQLEGSIKEINQILGELEKTEVWDELLSGEREPEDLKMKITSMPGVLEIDLSQLGIEGKFTSREEAVDAIKNKLNILQGEHTEKSKQTQEIDSRISNLRSQVKQLGEKEEEIKKGIQQPKLEEIIRAFNNLILIFRDPTIAPPRREATKLSQEDIEAIAKRVQEQREEE